MKYWESLLLNWRKQGRDGLTIPYIVGSQKYLADQNRQSIRQLIDEIALNERVEIYLNYCLTINDLILAVRDESKFRLPLKNVYMEGKPSSLFISTFLGDFSNNVESVIEILTERYQNHIDEGGFL